MRKIGAQLASFHTPASALVCNDISAMDIAAREFLESLFRSAVAAAHPSGCLPAKLPEPPPRGRLVILAAGKAAGSMAQVGDQRYADPPQHRIARPGGH